MQVIEHKPPNRVIAWGEPGIAWSRYLEATRVVSGYDEHVWDRIGDLSGILIGSRYAHLSLNEAALELLAGDAAKPAQAGAWVLALLMAQVRLPQRDAIGSSPKYRLKRRSGHHAREPPPCEYLIRLGSMVHVGYHVPQCCSRVWLSIIGRRTV